MVAWMAPEVAPASPQLCPEWKIQAQARSSAMSAACRAKEPMKPPPSRSPLGAMLRARVVSWVSMVCGNHSVMQDSLRG